MNLDAAWAAAQAAQFAVMGVPAVVRRPAPADTPISTSIIWVDATTENAPDGARFQRRDRRRIAVFDRAAVPTLERGSRVDAPETQGGPIKNWVSDGTERADVDTVRAVVVPAE